MSDQVTFIRKNGRIIPIKKKKNSDQAPISGDNITKKRRKRDVARSVFKTTGYGIFTTGGLIASAGQLFGASSTKARDKILETVKYRRSVSGVRQSIDASLKLTKVAKVSRKIEAVGLAISAVGASAGIIEYITRRK